jgi:predicted Zn-dependent peptidase
MSRPRPWPQGRALFALALCIGFFLTSPGWATPPSPASAGFDFSLLENAVAEKRLANGLRILVLPRPEIPVVSLVTWANVGGADDPKGLSGMAHMFEHMAFKGTTTVGSRDPENEPALMAAEDEAFAALQAERAQGRAADPARLASLTATFDQAIAEAYKVVEPSAFANLLQREGASGLNAFTSRDQTAYIVSLPSNKIELWMALEAERFRDPVLREMYKEREVVAEERRMTVENNPTGKLVEDFLATAFKAHPYGEPLIGHMSDILNYSRAAAQACFEAAYSPGNLTLALVGDITPERAFELAEKYWGPIPSRPAPLPIHTVEPPQLGERRVILEDRAQPTLLIGWHVPEGTHPDTPALSALIDLLGQGRTSRLHRRLVRDEKSAVAISAFNGWPGNKYPALAVVFANPAPGSGNATCETAIHEEIEKFRTDLVPEEEVAKVKARAMASFVRRMRSNMGLAQLLATYQQLWGDWRELFRELDRINTVTAEDIRRVAQTYFTRRNRTVAALETLADQTASSSPAPTPPAPASATPPAPTSPAASPTLEVTP